MIKRKTTNEDQLLDFLKQIDKELLLRQVKATHERRMVVTSDNANTHKTKEAKLLVIK